MRMESYSVESVVRGYHVYKEIWDGHLQQVLSVSVLKDSCHRPHSPCYIVSLLLLSSKKTLHCQVIGSRHYSKDLAKGGLEIPFIVKNLLNRSIDIRSVKACLTLLTEPITEDDLQEPPSNKLTKTTDGLNVMG